MRLDLGRFIADLQKKEAEAERQERLKQEAARVFAEQRKRARKQDTPQKTAPDAEDPHQSDVSESSFSCIQSKYMLNNNIFNSELL
jgi:hypothetical protein